VMPPVEFATPVYRQPLPHPQHPVAGSLSAQRLFRGAQQTGDDGFPSRPAVPAEEVNHGSHAVGMKVFP